MDALNCFRAILADLKDQLSADNISAYLYTDGLLTQSEFEAVNHIMHTSDMKITILLSAVEKAIHIEPQNFSKFLDNLDRIDKYRPIASRARGELLSIVKEYV